ncbi:MAG: glycerol-3-phosphate dehydrogenase [Burkholderiales bacterium]|nr:glycerol-3-phosphate dehydrogenase [Burkholderiales bacterium]
MTPPAEPFDLVVIGGGINGAGIARDAAGRGLRVALVEQGDLGSATSSASTRLIHGGLRYLEHFEFRLVAESLAEREVLLRVAPHVVWPLEFVLPHEPHLRPRWMIRTGLFLYDHLSRRVSLPGSRGVRLTPDRYGAGLRPDLTRGFTYSDCAVDDARLVVLTARSAAEQGATILPRTRCVAGRRDGALWRVSLADADSGARGEAACRALVNAAGPWVRTVLDRALAAPTPGDVRLVKGSHIVVPRIHGHAHAVILQNPDGRVIFLIPYEDDYTEIGTTDVPIGSMETPPACSREETEYLCAAASRYTLAPVTPDQVVHAWSGVRPLYDDGTDDPSAITRDYRFVLDENGPPLLSVFGGKLTTYRRLAEAALEKLAKWFPGRHPWTERAPLPGGDFGGASFDELAAAYRSRYPRLDARWLGRLLRRHGTCAAEILDDVRQAGDLGEAFGGGLYEREVRFLVEREWARTPEDVLWRRTKCGLRMTRAQRERLAEAMGTKEPVA